MKNKMIYKSGFIALLIIGLLNGLVMAQDTKAPSKSSSRVYSTFGGEIIFSWADASKEGLDAKVITRFSPVFNGQWILHMDMGQHAGFFSGLSIRNVGYIYDDPTEFNVRYKARSYTLGIPIALKAGNMSGFFLFGGYEIEFPFNFKEKKFVNEDKVEKNTSWFSKKTPTLYNTLFAGIQTSNGIQLKFKYYLTNFFNKDYAANDGSGNIIYPYREIEANVFYVSLSFQMSGRRFH